MWARCVSVSKRVVARPRVVSHPCFIAGRCFSWKLIKERDISNAEFLRRLWMENRTEEAISYFDEMRKERTTVHWNQMLSGLANCGEHHRTMVYFKEMRLANELYPDRVVLNTSSFSPIIQCFAERGEIRQMLHWGAVSKG